MIALMIYMAVALFAVRLNIMRRLWRLPLKNGEGFFLAQRVGPGFYREAGVPLMQRYHVALFVPLVLDVPLVSWLAATQRYAHLFFEQFIMMMVTLVVYNVMVVHFTYRAMAVAGIEEDRPVTVQLSMSPRRLRDFTNRAVEAVIAVVVLLSLATLAHDYSWSARESWNKAAYHAFQRGVVITIWILYFQVGLLLLKSVFVRWRMPLPVNRTEDFRRWRSAWLTYHLKLFDAVRVLAALALLSSTLSMAFVKGWTRPSIIIAGGLWILILVVYTVYIAREQRRMVVVEREVKPIELVKEFPRRAVSKGRFFAGGLLYFNRDNPGVLVRSAGGIAINMAHPSTYVWPAYFIGLATLMIWMAR
jgi:hypothetical protein